MHLTKNKTKTLQIAVVAIFMTVAAFATAKPAQAKWGVRGGYKYLSLGYTLTGYSISADAVSSGHGAKLLLTRSLGDSHRVGLGIGGGYITDYEVLVAGRSESGSISGGGFLLVSGNYEYVFPFGLGISGGFGVTPMFYPGETWVGVGVSDLGVTYRIKKKKGFLLYANVDLMGVVPPSNIPSGFDVVSPFLWGLGIGLGYEF